MRILSWNLYYRGGAAAADVAHLIHEYRPDLFLMQEVTLDIHELPEEVGGHFYRQPWRGKRYGLAVWARQPLRIRSLSLPYSRLPGKFPPRAAQVVEHDGITVANVHLSHGQVLNRRQLRTIGRGVRGPMAIIGDFNAVGPVFVRGFRDVGPRRTTHYAREMVPFRLDRCLIRDLLVQRSEALAWGASDHRPICMELDLSPSHHFAHEHS
ncbi:MAG: endonuclease/exonuclease/phosphatase family protein [Hyphomicrobiaceae bacterium]|nr:endonuclease/exonuclease/phosphatase family protein [Hyphomicrobiaceae bacterium]